MPIKPIHTDESCSAAYQLNWALSLFGHSILPGPSHWLEEIQPALEADGVHILEAHSRHPDVLLFFVSTKPALSPSEIVRFVKGRVQYAIRAEFPTTFRRNYRIESMGSVTTDIVLGYVAKQTERHPAETVREQLERIDRQLIDTEVDLNRMQSSSHGQFLYNLHLVVSQHAGSADFTAAELESMRVMLRRLCESSSWRLARAGLVGDHLHLALGLPVDVAPAVAAVRILNNLEYSLGMKSRLRPSYYAGTFGPR
ncbi:MAG: hypothetical protein FJ267_12665, partial [Planctomycetes bacterium]|nr:hypothetical protein [Planctomycetota bacterium]